MLIQNASKYIVTYGFSITERLPMPEQPLTSTLLHSSFTNIDDLSSLFGTHVSILIDIERMSFRTFGRLKHYTSSKRQTPRTPGCYPEWRGASPCYRENPPRRTTHESITRRGP